MSWPAPCPTASEFACLWCARLLEFISECLSRSAGCRPDLLLTASVSRSRTNMTTPTAGPNGDVGFHHYAFELRSRRTWTILKELGAPIVDPADEYDDDYYAVFLLDPDGVKLEGMKYGEHHARAAKRKRPPRPSRPEDAGTVSLRPTNAGALRAEVAGLFEHLNGRFARGSRAPMRRELLESHSGTGS
jgi:hypothetical protein